MNREPEENPYRTPESHAGIKKTGSVNELILRQIKSEATSSLLWGMVGILCCGIVLSPVAIVRGRDALRLIKQHDIGHQFQQTAIIGIVVGSFGFAIFFVGLLLLVFFPVYN